MKFNRVWWVLMDDQCRFFSGNYGTTAILHEAVGYITEHDARHAARALRLSGFKPTLITATFHNADSSGDF